MPVQSPPRFLIRIHRLLIDILLRGEGFLVLRSENPIQQLVPRRASHDVVLPNWYLRLLDGFEQLFGLPFCLFLPLLLIDPEAPVRVVSQYQRAYLRDRTVPKRPNVATAVKRGCRKIALILAHLNESYAVLMSLLEAPNFFDVRWKEDLVNVGRVTCAMSSCA